MTTKKKTIFAESCIPPLKSGEYELSVYQDTNRGKSDIETQRIVIEGPRFCLQDKEIAALYPPSNMVGSFGDTLPHIIFHRKTLPWERQITPIESDQLTDNARPLFEKPWIALVTLHDNEVQELEANKCFNTTTIEKMSAPPNGTFFPQYTPTPQNCDALCAYIDMPVRLFSDIIPSERDLPYLCHARKSDTITKNSDGTLTEQWNSVIIGNRLPQISRKGSLNTVILVSLEGYGEILNHSQGYEKIRLNILYRWSFYGTEKQFHLRQLFQNLSVAPLRQPQSEFIETENKTESEKQLREALRKILDNGYIPLRHTFRTGDKTRSFYRGPLIPFKKVDDNIRNLSSSGNADKLYIYDPSTGMFDVSYAVAWQIGRLLALNRKKTALLLMRNRNKDHLEVMRSRTEEALLNHLPNCSNANLSDSSIGDALFSNLTEALGELIK